MKRGISFVLLLLLLAAMFSVTANAEGQGSLPYHVSDVAGLLSTEEWQSLETEAERISGKYQCGVYLVILDDFRDYRTANEDYWTFSQNFYRSYGLGVGEEKNGILTSRAFQGAFVSSAATTCPAEYPSATSSISGNPPMTACSATSPATAASLVSSGRSI